MTALEKSFDRIADLYDRARPTYPSSVFERMLEFAGIDASARMLEVGTGTGKATLPLAQRGFRILGLEPGANMAQLARTRLAEFGNAEVRTISFEDWEAPLGAFDFAFAAQAFHWLSPEQRLPKFAQALRRGGALAVFGNAGGVAPGVLRDAIQAVYREHAPALCGRDGAQHAYGSEQSPLFQELRSSSLFTDARCEITTWEQTASSEGYCALQASYSDHSTLPPNQLEQVLSGSAKVIAEHGGTVPLQYRTGLFLVRRV